MLLLFTLTTKNCSGDEVARKRFVVVLILKMIVEMASENCLVAGEFILRKWFIDYQ